MKFLTLENHLLGTLIEEQVVNMEQAYEHYNVRDMPATMLELVKSGYDTVFDVWKIALQARNDNIALLNWQDITPSSPIPLPVRNIFCLGKNYQDHVAEMDKRGTFGKGEPDNMIIFTKSPNTVIGPQALIPNHADITDSIDYEAEVALIIGKGGNKISKQRAWEHVFGYTAMNDITARNLQKDHHQWFLGKSLDGFAPMGPVIVHRSSMLPLNRIEVKSYVNGELRQSSTLDKLIFKIPEIIHEISQGITLYPGDIIATGTPSGVGAGFDPPRYLKPGDEVIVDISEVSPLINYVEK